MAPELAFTLGMFMANVPSLADNPQVTCLTENIYYEARAEPLRGLFAVAEVTNNRVDSKVFKPQTHCGVIHQRHQFSWVLNKYPVREPKMWERSKAVAVVSYHFGNITETVPEALFFHSGKPLAYHSKLQFLEKIGGHRFYTLKGK